MKLLLLTLSLFIFIVTVKAQAPKLWGTCAYGGAFGFGAIIQSDSTGNSFQVVYSFDQTNGSLPLGNLCSGGNGKLYGVTELGGYDDSCVCFSYDTSTGAYMNFHNLYQNWDSGYGAYSGMMRAADGMLYGMTSSGGLNSAGVIYRVDPSLDSYSPLYNFNLSTGGSPLGGLIQLSDGKLYGMTYSGGVYGVGVIFSFNPADSTYLVLYDFITPGGGNPYYGSLLNATDGKLYGLTSGGGIHLGGVIFSYDLANDTYSDLHDFDLYNSDGGYPHGSLIQANNGLLYGMTLTGGVNSNGIIFSYNPVTQDYFVLHSFNSTEGTYPERSLTQGSNGKLFGIASGGGLNAGGTAFSFDITGNIFTKLIDFSTIGCSYSSCDILETGVKEIADNIPVLPGQNMKEFVTYPNPVIDNVTMSGKILTPKTQVELWNDQGKRIVDFTMKGNTLNVSSLAPGFYIVKITEDNSAGIGKFMKE